ncbi:MAG: NAD(P)-binding protein, partial [Calditrichaeota bacterium]|nr:NAD(P)-binding protein [Calditrichota bacterium]
MDRYRTDTNSPAVIIGAGPAGLTAGYELFKLGHPSVILEADEMVGGISRTVNYQGYRFDIGGHRFFSKVPYVNDLWHEILQDDFILRPRLSRIHYKGHFFDYPLKAMNALAGLGPYEAMMVMLSYLRAKAIPYNGGSEDNFEQWVANRFGYRLYSIFFKTYTEKVWGIPCHEISADWAAQRIKNLSLKRAIYNALVGSAKSMNGEVITTLIEQFHYPRLGPGMMWERCAELLEAQGSPTVFGQPVQQIYHHNGRVTAIKALNRRGEATEITGREFISTMPLRELIFSLSPAPP